LPIVSFAIGRVNVSVVFRNEKRKREVGRCQSWT